MKTITPDLAALINSLPTGGTFQYCHIYTITLPFFQGGTINMPFSSAATDAGVQSWWANESMIVMSVRKGIGVTTNTTTANGAVAAGNVLTLTSVTGMQVGDNITDITTPTAIPANTNITVINSGTKQVTMTNNVAGGGVLNNDTIVASSAGLGGRPIISLRRNEDGYGASKAMRRPNAAATSSTGQGVIYLTDGPINVSWNGKTYLANTIKVDSHGNKRLAHWKRGLDVDQTTLSLAPRLTDPITGASFPDKIGSVPFIEAARGGALDGADIQIDRAFFTSWPQPYTTPITPAGTITIFAGTPAEVDTGDTLVVLTINDYRQLLQTKFPRTRFQLQCNHTLYDVGCTLNAVSFSRNGTCASTSTKQMIVANADITAPTNPGSGTFTLGKVTMTSGLNAGFSRTVRQWTSPRTFALINPFPFTVSAGDTFTAALGCDKQLATCQAFANQANFGGNPYVPDATTAT